LPYGGPGFRLAVQIALEFVLYAPKLQGLKAANTGWLSFDLMVGSPEGENEIPMRAISQI
jgi:hypothetical protein